MELLGQGAATARQHVAEARVSLSEEPALDHVIVAIAVELVEREHRAEDAAGDHVVVLADERGETCGQVAGVTESEGRGEGIRGLGPLAEAPVVVAEAGDNLPSEGLDRRGQVSSVLAQAHRDLGDAAERPENRAPAAELLVGRATEARALHAAVISQAVARELLGVEREQVVGKASQTRPLALEQVAAAVPLIGTDRQVGIGELPEQRALAVRGTVGADTHEGGGLGQAAPLRLVAPEVGEGLVEKPPHVKEEGVGGEERDHVAAVAQALAGAVLPQTVDVVELGSTSRIDKLLVEGVVRDEVTRRGKIRVHVARGEAEEVSPLQTLDEGIAERVPAELVREGVLALPRHDHVLLERKGRRTGAAGAPSARGVEADHPREVRAIEGLALTVDHLGIGHRDALAGARGEGQLREPRDHLAHVNEEAAVQLAHVAWLHDVRPVAVLDHGRRERAPVGAGDDATAGRAEKAQVSALAEIDVVEGELSLSPGPGAVGTRDRVAGTIHDRHERLRSPDLGQALAQVVLPEEGQGRGVVPTIAELHLDGVLAWYHQVGHVVAVAVDKLVEARPLPREDVFAHAAPVQVHHTVAERGDLERDAVDVLDLEASRHDLVMVVLIIPGTVRAVIKVGTRHPQGTFECRELWFNHFSSRADFSR